MKQPISRRHVLQAALALPVVGLAAGCARSPARPAAPTRPGPLADLDGVATAAAVRSGQLGIGEAVEAAIARAQVLDASLNAIVTENYERARARTAATPAGPFAGVPSFVKDLDDLRGLPTRSGSRSFGLLPATEQGPYVDALERAGLVFLGKSSTPEFGLTGSTEPLLHGPTRNPWNPDYSPGGSSGGAAALVAARVVPIAHATDGGGSIRVPASCCGLFGLKPSRGRTVPLGRVSGPVEIGVGHAVSISVRDSEHWLAFTERTGAERVFEPIGIVGAPSSRRLRIGLDLEPLAGNALDPEVRTAIDDTARKCEALGHRVELAPLPLPKRELLSAFMLYWSSGAAMIADGLEKRLGRPLTDADLEPWTLGLRDYYRAQRDGFEAAVATIRSTSAACAAFHERYDVLLTPVATRLPFRIGELAPDLPFETHFERATGYVGFTPIQNGAGTPGMSVPLHWSKTGLPIGSHFAAKAGDERTLLELAFELEAAHPWAGRRPPVAAT
jgi:amidase